MQKEMNMENFKLVCSCGEMLDINTSKIDEIKLLNDDSKIKVSIITKDSVGLSPVVAIVFICDKCNSHKVLQH